MPETPQPPPPHHDPYGQTLPSGTPNEAPTPAAQPQSYKLVQPQTPISQSKMGKLSVAAGLLGGMAVLGAIVLAGVTAGNASMGAVTERIAGLAVIGAMTLNLLGLGLAVLGFIEKNVKRGTVWAGLLLNGMPCLCGGGLVAFYFIAFMDVSGRGPG
jgi:hypothetical protein